jgi:NitT/TauT family transport system ATP-binding protein
MAGLEAASRGSVLLGGRAVTRPSARVGLVFQEYALFPWRTTRENIEMGLEIKGFPKQSRRQKALEYVKAFGLSGFENSYPRELSGGMQQRVAIARTLVMQPEVVLMDEPFGSLDSQTRNAMQQFLLDIWQDRRDTIIFVTHNVDEAVFLSDEILVLSRRPARLIHRLSVDCPRPRDRTGTECNQVRRQVLEVLSGQQKEENVCA